MFLRRRIIPNNLTVIRRPIEPLDWDKEVRSWEEARVQRTSSLIKNSKSVKNYVPLDQVILQDTDRKGHWTQKGKIISMTKGKNSYIVELEDGTRFERHHHQMCDDKSHPLYRNVEIIPQTNSGSLVGNEEIDIPDSGLTQQSEENQGTVELDALDEPADYVTPQVEVTQTRRPGGGSDMEQYSPPLTRFRARALDLTWSW